MNLVTDQVGALNAAFRPRNIAVIGASNSSEKIGGVILGNLRGFKGQLYPVHRTSSSVLGHRAYPSIKAVPQAVDLAIVAVEASQLAEALADCAQAGVKCALVIASGLGEGESGGKTREMLDALKEKKGGVRLIGPNSSGLINVHADLNASFLAGGMPARGGVSIASQSGSTGGAAIALSRDHGVGFSKIVDCGNAFDLPPLVYLSYFGIDPETSVIALFLESIGVTEPFLQEVRKIVPKKPVLICKTTCGSDSARAARMHSGTKDLDASSRDAHDLLKESGAVVVDDTSELLDLAQFLDWQPLPDKRGRVGVITHSGGAGVELSGLLERRGLRVPELPPELRRELSRMLPHYASTLNPIDTTPVWNQWAEVFASAVEALMAAPNIDVIVIILQHRPTSRPEMLQCIKDAVVREQQRRPRPKPVVVCWASTRENMKNRMIFEEAKIPCYDRPVSVANVLAGAAAIASRRGE